MVAGVVVRFNAQRHTQNWQAGTAGWGGEKLGPAEAVSEIAADLPMRSRPVNRIEGGTRRCRRPAGQASLPHVLDEDG
jgi:hypothetical protein